MRKLINMLCSISSLRSTLCLCQNVIGVELQKEPVGYVIL